MEKAIVPAAVNRVWAGQGEILSSSANGMTRLKMLTGQMRGVVGSFYTDTLIFPDRQPLEDFTEALDRLRAAGYTVQVTVTPPTESFSL